MSDTIVDMPKVTQMLDAGWEVHIYRNGPSYVARGRHDNKALWDRAKAGVLAQMVDAHAKDEGGLSAESCREINDLDFDEPCEIDTDDFTPEQALTRLAYKVHGELL